MPGIGIVAIGATKQAARHEQHDPQSRPIVTRGRFVGVGVAEGAFGVVAQFAFVRRVGRNPDVQIVPAAGFEGAELRHRSAHTCPWKVRLMTSICCSRVSRTKFTAYPETRIVSCGYLSGFFIASSSVSLSTTFRFMWNPPWSKYMSNALAAASMSSASDRCAFWGATETV